MAATATPGLPMVVTTLVRGTSRPAAAPDNTVLLALLAEARRSTRVLYGLTWAAMGFVLGALAVQLWGRWHGL